MCRRFIIDPLDQQRRQRKLRLHRLTEQMSGVG